MTQLWFASKKGEVETETLLKIILLVLSLLALILISLIIKSRGEQITEWLGGIISYG